MSTTTTTNEIIVYLVYVKTRKMMPKDLINGHKSITLTLLSLSLLHCVIPSTYIYNIVVTLYIHINEKNVLTIIYNKNVKGKKIVMCFRAVTILINVFVFGFEKQIKVTQMNKLNVEIANATSFFLSISHIHTFLIFFISIRRFLLI